VLFEDNLRACTLFASDCVCFEWLCNSAPAAGLGAQHSNDAPSVVVVVLVVVVVVVVVVVLFWFGRSGLPVVEVVVGVVVLDIVALVVVTVVIVDA